MLYCPKSHYVVLEEDELRDVVNYLDHLSSLHLSSDFDLKDLLDDFNGILREWDGDVEE